MTQIKAEDGEGEVTTGLDRLFKTIIRRDSGW